MGENKSIPNISYRTSMLNPCTSKNPTRAAAKTTAYNLKIFCISFSPFHNLIVVVLCHYFIMMRNVKLNREQVLWREGQVLDKEG
jgi:hypothetical protein